MKIEKKLLVDPKQTVADVIGVMMWCKYFMEARRYIIDNNLLYQDDKLTVLLAKNGRTLIGKTRQNIHHQFFLIPDKR